MSEAENLHTVAEVGIALAGFSGVVVALGQRSGNPAGIGRLWLLLAQALGAVIFAFLPLLLESAGLEPSANWRAPTEQSVSSDSASSSEPRYSSVPCCDIGCGAGGPLSASPSR